VQSPGIKWLQDIPADQRPPLLISHALTEGKVLDPKKIVGTGNHARAHPLYSGWNIMTMLSLRLAQGRNGTSEPACPVMQSAFCKGSKCFAILFFSYVFSFLFIFDCDAHARAQRARYLPACHHLDQI
jgi:hypothetical protein